MFAVFYNCNNFIVHCYIQVLNFKSYVATVLRKDIKASGNNLEISKSLPGGFALYE